MVSRLCDVLRERTQSLEATGGFVARPSDSSCVRALEGVIELEYFSQSPTLHALLVTYTGVSSRPGSVVYDSSSGAVSVRCPRARTAPYSRKEAYRSISLATQVLAREFAKQNT